MGEIGGRCEEFEETREDAFDGPRRGLEARGTIPVPVLSISWATDVSVLCQFLSLYRQYGGIENDLSLVPALLKSPNQNRHCYN